ncbi:hypothetical protein EUTSA_v10022210mg [Eutrema salsugineum]|uniref:Uncharacterized protein n=1 Tax=Eutrema salsugineum TaxID=72664 RepID=V4LHD3_EUTSA|nr:hypothetical protein EUTSA_v10022210mg [Eutrema salsugineum]
MEIFKKAAIVRLRSHNEKNVIADEDQESVHQDRRGTTKNTRWTVEIIPGSNVIRLQSCYGKYLTATNIHFLLGATGKKVLQTLPEKLDSSAEWEPILIGQWYTSVRTVTQDWILWSVDVLQIRVIEDDSDSSHTSSTFSRIQSGDSFTVTLPLKSEGRLIYYEIGDDCGNINNDRGKKSLIFHGSELTELKKKLEEETGIEDVMVCSRNPLTEKLCPLQLHLPPNNATMHIFNSSFLLHSVLRNDS